MHHLHDRGLNRLADAIDRHSPSTQPDAQAARDAEKNAMATDSHTTPIIHRLGDMDVGDPVRIREGGVEFIAACSDFDDPDSVEVRIGEGRYEQFVSYPDDTPCIRLIPETPLTKHAGEMYAELADLLASLEHATDFHRDHHARSIRALLSRLDSEGGAA